MFFEEHIRNSVYFLMGYLILVCFLQIPPSAVTSIIDGLKRLYIEKLKPLEVTYRFNDFVSPLLVSGSSKSTNFISLLS